MATVDVRRPHSVGREAALARAERFADDSDMISHWERVGDTVRFDAVQGAEGVVTATDTEVRVEVDLPLMLRPFKGTVTQRLEAELDRALAGG